MAACHLWNANGTPFATLWTNLWYSCRGILAEGMQSVEHSDATTARSFTQDKPCLTFIEHSFEEADASNGVL
jgi:hypothetical protein